MTPIESYYPNCYRFRIIHSSIGLNRIKLFSFITEVSFIIVECTICRFKFVLRRRIRFNYGGSGRFVDERGLKFNVGSGNFV